MKFQTNIIAIIIILFSNVALIFSDGNYSLKFPFTTIEKKEPELTTYYNRTITNEVMKNIYLNEIFINLEIGSPPQKIYLRLSVNSDDFFISKGNAIFEKNYPKKEGNYYYDQTKSSTFKRSDKKDDIYFSHVHTSEYVMDDIIFYVTDKKINKINIKEFGFFLANKVNGPNHGIVGLKNYPYSERRDDFFSSLKKFNLIKNKIWFLDFENSNKNGKLIMGNYPHFDENILKSGKNKFFDLNHFEKIYSVVNNEKWDSTWGLTFNKIYMKNASTSYYDEIINKNENFKNVILNPNFGVIIASQNFKIPFEVTFLNKYLNNRICYQPILTLNRNYEQKSFYYYYCNASYIEQMKKDFNPILFEHKEFKFNFSLEFDDLYVQKNKYIYLRIIFDGYSPNWVFGSPFFSKFTLFFDSDSKEIGFYSPNINHNIIKENFNKNVGQSVSKIILHILLCIILIIIGIFIGKKIYGLKRKLRANELEEKFEYKPAEKQMQTY